MHPARPCPAPPVGDEKCHGEPMNLPNTQWVHTLGHHDIGSVIGWRGEDSPTGWRSGIVRERGSACVRVEDIRPGVMANGR
jgi:hypothetical protein